MTTVTTPPRPSLPLPSTPLKPRSANSERFAPRYDNRSLLFSRLSLEMAPYFVGPVPPEVFIEEFLPVVVPANATFTPKMFSALKVSNEAGMFTELVKAVESYIPQLTLIDTSRKKDHLPNTAFSLECQPDCTVMDRDAIKAPSGFDSSRAEFFIEFKSGPESDPFKNTSLIAVRNRYLEDLPMDMAPTVVSGTDVTGQFTAYSALILGSQYRTHTFLVLILGEYARLIRWDRGGAVVSDKIHYDKDPCLFDFLVRYNHASRVMRGHDETVRDSTEDEVRDARDAVHELKAERRLLTVELNDRPYVIRAPCAQPDIPVGRWTRTSVAFDLQNKNRVFLKDSWRIVHNDIIPEGDIYAMLEEHGVRNVPHCLDSGDVGNDLYHKTQTHQFTHHCRRECKSNFITHRHYRLILDTVGRNLYEFDRSKDMVKAIHASLIAHKMAYEHAHVLHRDISAGNIMIVDHNEAKPHIKEGMLIDWDLSKMVDAAGTMGAARQHTRTGTWQFMAADLIENPNTPHTYVHDLESVFWVLIWVVVSFMPTSLSDSQRSSFLKDVMSPRLYGDTGAPAKRHFFSALDIPRVPKVVPVQNLLVRLAKLMALRHKRKQISVPELPTDQINEDVVMNQSFGPEDSDEEIPNVSSQTEEPPGAQEIPVELRDHFKTIYYFYEAIIEHGWPRDDGAHPQPKLPSTEEVRLLRTGSDRSRYQAEKSGVFIRPS